MADDSDTRRALEDLGRRIERIERHLQLDPHAISHEAARSRPLAAPGAGAPVGPGHPVDSIMRSADAVPPREAIAASAITPPIAPPIVSPTSPPTAPPISTPAAAPSSLRDVFEPARRSREISREPLSWRDVVRKKPDAVDADAPRRSWETLIGERWLAWLGSITVVIGAIFLAGYIDVGSVWGALPPLVKCLILTAFGAGLLIGGEILMRRFGLAAAVGLYAAGLGTLYITAYASFGWYNLISETSSLVLMGAVSAGGCALTLRTKSIAIGTLSLIGAFLAPLLLRSAPVAPLAQPLYLTGILAVGLAMSFYPWRRSPAPAALDEQDEDDETLQPATALPRDHAREIVESPVFRPLRYVAIGGLIALATLWILKSPALLWRDVLVFGGIWWIMVAVESLVAAMRRQSPAGNAVATLLMTAWYVTATCWLLDMASPMVAAWQGGFTLGMAVLASAIAFQFGPGIEVLRGRVHSPIAKFAASLLAQAGVLLVVAVALQFDGYGQSISWLAIAVASIEIGRRLPSRAVDRFGLIVGALAIARIATFDAFASPALRTELIDLDIASITGWTLLVLGAIAATIFAAHRIHDGAVAADLAPANFPRAPFAGPGFLARTPRRHVQPHALMAIAVTMWMILASLQIEARYITWAWLAAGAAILALRNLGEHQRYFSIAQAVIFISALKWLAFDTLAVRTSGEFPGIATGDTMMVLLNPQMLLGVALAAVLWWFLRVQKERATLPDFEEQVRRGELDPGLQFSPALTGMARSAWSWAPVAAAVIILWGLSFELDRLLGDTSFSADSIWSSRRLLPLSLCILWGAGGFALFFAGLARGRRALVQAGLILVMLSSAVWLTVATFLVSLMDPARNVTPLANPQFMSAVLLAAMLGAMVGGVRGRASVLSLANSHDPTADSEQPTAEIRYAALALIGLIGLWIGTIEIDRALVGSAMQAALSIFWALYGILLIALGFWKRAAAVRYAGLALLGVTLVKVAMLDTRQLEGIYRPLSYIAVGLLFVAASIGYTRLSPRLLGKVDG